MSEPLITGRPVRVRDRNARGSGARLRADILAGAAELLDEAGEQAVTLRAVARRVGITAPAIYGHFADRQAVLLAVAQAAFHDLTEALAAVGAPDPRSTKDQAVQYLRAVSAAYLDFAAGRPQRYRVMFEGLWNAQQAVDDDAITPEEAFDLGQEALAVFVAALDACVRTGASGSTDTGADAVALWLGLHGLASQRAVSPAFPWPPGIADRLVDSLARLI